jgi:pilus assembly protein CpaE
MHGVVATDSKVNGSEIREILLHDGHLCQMTDVVLLAQAGSHLAQTHPDFLVLDLSPDAERALVVLQDIRESFGGAVLVVGPVADPKLILRAQREGASQFLDESDLRGELKSGLSRLQTESQPQIETGQLIAVMSPCGGSGASTLAVNLAALLAKKFRSCLLFDLDVETGILAPLLNLSPTHTVAELCLNCGRMDRSMFEQLLVQHESGVQLLAPPRLYADIGYVTPDGVRKGLAMARSFFPYVVVDLDRSFREEQILVLQQADLIFLIFRLDFTSLRNTRRTLDRIEQLGLNPDRVRLVANRYGQAKEVPPGKAEEALGVKIFHYLPDEPKTINRANNNGIPAVLEAPRSYVSKSIAKLALTVNGRERAS